MKIRTLIKAPILTQSGYGTHSRQIFQSLVSDPLFDVYVEPINWGHCSYITEDTPLKRQITQCAQKFAMAKHQGQEQFDLFVHVSIPNEFEKKGTFNVGVTAGIESDRVSHVWIQKANEMDLLIVPSEHSKAVFTNTVIDWQNTQTGQTGQLRLEKPIVVCSEGFDANVFKPHRLTKAYPAEFKPVHDKFDFEPEFNFLSVGLWGKGGLGEDRKNISLLVKWFIESFHGRRDVGLVLKTSMAKNSITDFEQIKQRLAQIKSNYKPEAVPPIYLVHANLTDEEMSALYNHPKIKAMISLTHGEGFGLPLLEAAACGLPVLTTNWSGHLDFLNLGKFVSLDYDLAEVPESQVWENIMIKGSKWANVKEEETKNRMRKITVSYSKPQEWAKELSQKIHNRFNLAQVGDTFVATIKQHMLKEKAAKINPKEHLESFIDTPENYNVLFTMPRSTGDVFVSTAVLDGLSKELPEDAKIYYATNPQYADLLKGNPHIYKVIPWNETMIQIDLTESVFDLVLTPDLNTQYLFSNWVRRGQGRLLAEEYANHCNCDLGEYHIEREPVEGLPETYMTIHTTSGKGQWEGRNYRDWKEVIQNIKMAYPDLKLVQVGSGEDPTLEQIDVDLRGKTSYQQLASVIENSMLHLSPDTFTMHVASALNVPTVALFGCSIPSSTGPWVKDKTKAKYILLQSERRTGCVSKPCYKNRCAVNQQDGAAPLNEIDPKEVVNACLRLLKDYE